MEFWKYNVRRNKEMTAHRGGFRECPYCRRLVETRVLPDGYSQVRQNGRLAKRRKIIHGTDGEGTGGCGRTWYTFEIVEDALEDDSMTWESE
jgi:hypothetical protein